MKLEKIGPLDALVRHGQSPSTCVVLFHGYGADAADLAPLANFLDRDNSLSWVFPNGPREVSVGMGMMGRAWFQIDMESWQKAMLTGEPRDLTNWEPEGLSAAVNKASSLLQTLTSSFDRVIVGGFSQGAMLSTEISLTTSIEPKALVLLSSGPIHYSIWQSQIVDRKKAPVFQSHGKHDEVLSYGGAQKVYDLFKRSGWPVEFTSFNGGHEIPPQVLNSLQKFLKTHGH
ncbi:MAG: esterase [Pseudobdellovibrionaceae bacterium]|nr:hypothetical protein [Bdellovibrionales bacterium]USN46576.1 MAG: esterase [Pseudobdellovibrionaceae bacterium]